MKGWPEWGNHVLKELERLNESQDKIESRLTQIEINIGMLQVKAGIWGAMAGTIPAVIAIAIAVLG